MEGSPAQKPPAAEAQRRRAEDDAAEGPGAIGTGGGTGAGALGPVAEVRRAIERALTEGGLRPRDGRILVALSGGPDSRVLLDALVALKEPLSLSLTVCVVDHGLRLGSDREAHAALEIARRIGVHGSVERVYLSDKSARSARDARYVALARAAVACRAQVIALAHTASDQAETLIDHLLRGAGSRGLGAMAPRRSLGALPTAGVATDHLQLVRPMLEVSRAQVEDYVDAEGLAVVRDPSNEDLRFRRSRLRQRVMPVLREERPDLDLALVRLSERLRQDADYLDSEAAAARARVAPGGPPGGVIDLDGLSALHPAIVARILREACEVAGVPGDRVPLDALLRLCRGRNGTSQIDLPGGVVAERRYAKLRIGAPDAPQPEPVEVPEVPVARAGTYELGRLRLRVPRALLGATATTIDKLTFRRPRAGDRVAGKKLSDLLIDQKIARPDRARLWVLAETKPRGRDTLRWAGLPDADAPGALRWEWPCSGLRPRPVASRSERPLTKSKRRSRSAK